VRPAGDLRSFWVASDAGLVAFQHTFETDLWDVGGKKLAAKITHPYYDDALGVIPSPDGKTLAVPYVGNDVFLWDLATRMERRLKGHADRVNAIVFSPGGRTLASASSDKTVKLWDAASGDPVANLRGHEQTVWLVQFSGDGKTLATCASDEIPLDYGSPGHGWGGASRSGTSRGRRKSRSGRG
jgi:WD40 repeat protein